MKIMFGILVFTAMFLLAGSEFAYNPPDTQKEFCTFVKLCTEGGFLPKK